MTALVLRGVSRRFGGVRALHDVTFTVRPRTIFGLIGPNGAGKSTLFNLITGVYRRDAGTLRFGDHDLSRLSPAGIARHGIARTFQNVRLFAGLTVLENLLVAAEARAPSGLRAALLGRASSDDRRARAFELLRAFDIDSVADAAAGSLAYGDQRRVEVARAMMTLPGLVLLDEPAAGMSSGEAEVLCGQIRGLRDRFGVAVMLVEHNMAVVLGVCDEVHVLDHGETLAHGTPDGIRRDPKVIAAYLGEAEDAPPRAPRRA